MKLKGIFTAIALLPLGCVQGGQQTPAPATAASPAQTAVVAPAPVPAVSAPEMGGTAPAPVAEATRPAARPASPPVPPPATPKAPAAAPRVRLIVPAGTLLPIEIQTAVSTATSREGDPVFAVLTEDVPLKGFKLDKGAEVRGRVLTAVSAKRVKGRAHLVIGFDGVMEKGEKISIATETIDSLAASTSGKDKKIIAGAAAAGLIVGAIKDGGKGAAIGTVVGAAAGTGAVLIMKGDEVEIPRGARLTVAVTK